MLIKQAHQKSAIFVTIALSIMTKFQQNVSSRYHNILMMSMNYSDIAILNIKGSNYHCIISLISKNGTVNLMQNAI